MDSKRISIIFLILIIICIFSIQPASPLSLVPLSYDDLYTNADQVILGTVVEKTELQTHTYYKMIVEKSYKNAFEETTIQILSELIIPEYPDYQTKLSLDKKYLLFLSDTGLKYQDFRVFKVYGVIQGVFRVEDGVASGRFNIVIYEDEIRLADDGHIVFRSIDFPEDMTVYDFREIYLSFFNEGGQFVRQKFNVSIIGSSETSYREKVSKIVGVKIGAGQSTRAKINLNLTRHGIFSIFINDTYIEDVKIHEAGFGSQGYNFSNIRVELSNLDWSKYKVVFEVTSGVSEYNEVYYRMVVNGEGDPDHNTHLNVPMKSEFEGAGTVTQWYPFGRNSMGTRKIVIWYRGLKILETTIDLGTGESHPIGSVDEKENSIPGFSFFTLLIGIMISMKRKIGLKIRVYTCNK